MRRLIPISAFEANQVLIAEASRQFEATYHGLIEGFSHVYGSIGGLVCCLFSVFVVNIEEVVDQVVHLGHFCLRYLLHFFRVIHVNRPQYLCFYSS